LSNPTIDTLSEFVSRLDRAGELVRVRPPVSLNLELCEIADRVMKQPGGGKALLFEQPILMNGQKSAFPVGINLFGSMRRMSMALGVESLDEIGVRIDEMLAMKVNPGTITSSPGPTSRPTSAVSRADVPEFTATAWRTPAYSATSFSH